ncbi:MAG: FAD:protein FMN transferase [Prolixibacteraceae bacterium]|nr:FAD:protein FMN transferase [Prolixibacteraceae bacterium]
MNNPAIFTDSFFALGTHCDVVITDVDKVNAKQIFQTIKSETEILEFLMSPVISDSPLSELNRTEQKKWIKVNDNTLWEVLTICYDYWQISNGAFDITVTPLVKLWKGRTSGLVTKQAIEQTKKSCGFDKVEFDFDQHKIQFLADGVEFDLGAIAKGIALDALKPLIEKQGMRNGIISFGESSVLAVGNHPNGDKWPVGIWNPYNPNDFIHVFAAQNSTVITSKTITNTDDGKPIKKNHIISPATGYPVQLNKTISVLSESAVMGEFLTTAFLILPENDRNLIADKIRHVELLEVEYNEENEYHTKLTLL